MATTSAFAFETTQSQWGSIDNLTDQTVDAGFAYAIALRTNHLYLAARAINRNYRYVLCGIGVPCNILSFLVLRRIKPLTSAILIMTLLSVIDSLALFTEFLFYLIATSGASLTGIYCSLILPCIYMLQYYPIWLVVLLTLERVVAVCFPLKAARVCTLSKARRSIILLFILDVLLCIVPTFTFEERPYSRGYSCYVKAIYVSLFNVFEIIDTLAFVIIPLSVLCLGNLAIIIKLRAPLEIDTVDDGSTIDRDNRRQNRSVTVMLLAVCTTTIICLLPNILLAYTDILSLLTNSQNVRDIASTYLLFAIINVLTMSNNVVNFFLYILTGSRFRAVLRDVVCSWIGKTNSH